MSLYIERSQGLAIGVEAAVVVLDKGLGNRLQIISHVPSK